MQPFGAIASSLVAVLRAEMGDKTQLLALVLSARFQRPVPLIAGIAIARAVNHALAAGPKLADTLRRPRATIPVLGNGFIRQPSGLEWRKRSGLHANCMSTRLIASCKTVYGFRTTLAMFLLGREPTRNRAATEKIAAVTP